LKANGKLAVDTNAVIAYRQGIPEVCSLIEGADTILLPVIVFGELLKSSLKKVWKTFFQAESIFGMFYACLTWPFSRSFWFYRP